MSEQPPEPDDLHALGQRLDEMHRREAAKAPKATSAAPLSVALRFSTELVVAIIAGGALGWGIDRLLGTRPIFMVVMFFLGAAAGIKNVMGAAKEMNERAAEAAKNEDRK